MNPLRSSTALKASLLITAMVCTSAPMASKADAQETAMEQLAKAIGDALKAATGKNVKKKRVVAEQMWAQPAMPALLTPEAELKQRKVRLEAYSEVAAAWLDGCVSLQPEQQRALRATLDKEIATSQQAAKKPQPNRNGGTQGFSDHFAITFTDKNGAGKGLNVLQQKHLLAEANLTPQQLAALDEAAKERQEFYESAALGHILNQLDDELYFTTAQRAAIADVVREKAYLSAACYALHPVNYYFQQTPITSDIANVKQLDFLGEAQKRRAADLVGQNQHLESEQYISFQSNEGVDFWQEKLRDAMKSQRQRMMRAVAVRVDFHRASNEMSESDARHLQVAGKGATDATIAQWKTTSLQQLKSYEEHALQMGNGNFGFSLSVPDVQQVDSDPIWKHTVERLLPAASQQLTGRNNVRSDATAKFIVAMLDRELWLTQAQRDVLIDAVRKELPSPDTKIQNANYFLEVTLLTIPMFKLSKQDLAVLTDSQKSAFEAMKEPFQMQNRYVVVQMKNGGQMHLQIPQ